MLKMIPALLNALKAGQELKDPAKWKKGQNLINGCAIVITGIVAVIRWQFPDVLISDDMIIELASIAALVLAFANRFITTASTKKIGKEDKK